LEVLELEVSDDMVFVLYTPFLIDFLHVVFEFFSFVGFDSSLACFAGLTG
jgi:hypothetical protein